MIAIPTLCIVGVILAALGILFIYWASSRNLKDAAMGAAFTAAWTLLWHRRRPGVPEELTSRVDEVRHEVSWDGATLDLTPTEFGLLAALAAMPGRAYSRYELVNRVRGYEFAGYERSIDSHVKNLRHKLGTDGAAVVETVHGVGYRLGLRRDR